MPQQTGRRHGDRPEGCDLGRALSEEVELLRAALPDTNIRFKSAGDTRGEFDVSRLREAVHNLATNAAKYGDKGTAVAIDVAGQPEQVLIKVVNAGVPLSPDARHVMFDPLRRGSNTASTGDEEPGTRPFPRQRDR